MNTSGWDTDCNSGNLGCLLGIKNGLAGLDVGPDWRGPVADRLYLPTADGGRGITDAVSESYRIVNIGRDLAGEEAVSPKGGARFHFSLPGSVQGFQLEDTVESRGTATLENVVLDPGSRGLAMHYRRLTTGRTARISTPTFTPSKEVAKYFDGRGYSLLASPTLYSGQTVRARILAASDNAEAAEVRLYIQHYDAADQLAQLAGEAIELSAGASTELEWEVPDTNGHPIASIGGRDLRCGRADRNRLPRPSQLGRRPDRGSGPPGPARLFPTDQGSRADHVEKGVGQRHRQRHPSGHDRSVAGAPPAHPEPGSRGCRCTAPATGPTIS